MYSIESSPYPECFSCINRGSLTSRQAQPTGSKYWIFFITLMTSLISYSSPAISSGIVARYPSSSMFDMTNSAISKFRSLNTTFACLISMSYSLSSNAGTLSIGSNCVSFAPKLI